MLLETLATPFFKARSVNQTSATFVSKIPTATEPSGDAGTATGASVFDIGKGYAQNGVLVTPYGIGSDNNTMSLRLIGWRSIGANAVATLLWIPVIICEVAATLSTAVGIVGKTVLDTERFADTLSLTTGNDDVSIDIVSPTGNVIAHFVADLKGFQKLEVSFTTGSSATSCNALLAFL